MREVTTNVSLILAPDFRPLLRRIFGDGIDRSATGIAVAFSSVAMQATPALVARIEDCEAAVHASSMTDGKAFSVIALLLYYAVQ